MKFDFLKEDDNSAAKAAVWYMVCQILVRGMAFLTSPIFTRLMSREDFGAVSNIFAWEAVIVPFITLNLRISINKSKYDFPDDNDSFLASILFFSNLVTGIVYLILECLGESYCFDIFGIKMTYIRLLFINIIFSTAFDYQQLQHNIFRKYKHFVFYTIISSVLRLLLSVAIVIIMQDKVYARLIGGVLPTVLVNTIIFINIYARCKAIRFKYISYAVNMSIPLLLSTMSSNILRSSDKIIISKYCGTDQTALYSVAVTISSIAAVLWHSMNQAWGPWLYDNLNHGNFEKIKSASLKFSSLYATLIVGLMLIAPEFLYFMGGAKYIEATGAMPSVILAMVCQFFYAFYFNIEYFYGETYIISLGTLLAALLNVALNFIFIPQYGYIAASYTTLVGYMFMLLYHFSIVKFKLRKSHVFTTKYFVLVICSLFVIQFILANIYNMLYLRYALLGLYLVILTVVAIKNKETIMFFANKLLKKNQKTTE